MAEKIFGYDWEDIRRAQRGGRLARAIAGPAVSDLTPERLAEDRALLAAHGRDGLAAMGYAGALDRLRRAGDLPAPITEGGN